MLTDERFAELQALAKRRDKWTGPDRERLAIGSIELLAEIVWLRKHCIDLKHQADAARYGLLR